MLFVWMWFVFWQIEWNYVLSFSKLPVELLFFFCSKSARVFFSLDLSCPHFAASFAALSSRACLSAPLGCSRGSMSVCFLSNDVAWGWRANEAATLMCYIILKHVSIIFLTLTKIYNKTCLIPRQDFASTSCQHAKFPFFLLIFCCVLVLILKQYYEISLHTRFYGLV